MLVSGGYPEDYEKGHVMTGFDNIENSIAFHAGTKQDGKNIVTAGGRVLALTSFGTDIKDALSKSFANAEKINYTKKYYRKDIGFDLV